jgi:cytosine/uracil/thiamine/allantoin permease
MQTPKIQRVIAILWPSFLMAGAATVLFFTAFDPHALLMDTRFADLSRLGAYTIGFFLFWCLTAASCLLTCYFQRPCAFRGEPENQA